MTRRPPRKRRYYSLLEQTCTHNELFYVGPREKEAFLSCMNKRLRDARLEGIVRNLFRPSYGGNRNCTLMYTLGGLMVSADDDMRPFALMEDSPESLEADEICRGRLHKSGQGHSVHKSFDIMAAFKDVLGKTVAETPENYERGEVLIDTAMELETNATKGLALENSLMLHRGSVSDRAVVKIAQTFRSGTNDIDAIDFVDMFLADEGQVDPDGIPQDAWRNDYGASRFRSSTLPADHRGAGRRPGCARPRRSPGSSGATA